MDFKKLFINMAVVGLLVFGIMAFVITTQANNNPGNSILNNTLINQTYGNLAANLTNSQSGLFSSSNNFQNITPDTNTIIGVDISPILSLTSTGHTIINGVFTNLIALPVSILGVSPIVASVVTAIIIMLILIGIWAILRGFVT